MVKKKIKAKKPARLAQNAKDVAAAVSPEPAAHILETAPEPAPELYRCIVENSFLLRGCECGRVFGKGQIVDLNETLPDGSKLKSHIRNSCFEPVRAGGV